MGPRPKILQSFLDVVGESSVSNKFLLRQFNWSALGIEVPYIIFFTGRCGSTWLRSLLINTELVGDPREYFNDGIAKRYASDKTNGLINYFSLIVQNGQSNNRFGTQIDTERLKFLVDIIDFRSLFFAKKSVVFFMYRRDIISQAWSWVVARKSGIWHNKQNEQQNQKINSDFDLPSLSEIASEVIRIKEGEEYLQRFFKKNGIQAIPIEYEAMVTDPIGVVLKILTSLSISREQLQQIKFNEITATNRFNYDNKYPIYINFYDRYYKAVLEIEKNRFSVSSKKLRHLFASIN